MKFDVEVDTDSLRKLISRTCGDPRPGFEEHVEALLSDTSIACALKASVELSLPQVVEIAARNLSEIVAEFCVGKTDSSNAN